MQYKMRPYFLICAATKYSDTPSGLPRGCRADVVAAAQLPLGEVADCPVQRLFDANPQYHKPYRLSHLSQIEIENAAFRSVTFFVAAKIKKYDNHSYSNDS
jgi:hypothetical protein